MTIQEIAIKDLHEAARNFSAAVNVVEHLQEAEANFKRTSAILQLRALAFAAVYDPSISNGD